MVKGIKTGVGQSIWLVSQGTNDLTGVYLADAVVVAPDEAEAVERVARFAEDLEWRYNEYHEPVAVIVRRGRLRPTWLGTSTVERRGREGDVLTFSIGRRWLDVEYG